MITHETIQEFVLLERSISLDHLSSLERVDAILKAVDDVKRGRTSGWIKVLCNEGIPVAVKVEDKRKKFS